MDVHLAKGARDFLPDAMQARLAVIDTIRRTFESFGFEPLETPAFERIETLAGKYGDETDKLMFRIHKRGADAAPGECDLALRYDLTVPLARVLAMNPDLRLPFKRWQIQPVWRAERPQKGRFREFWQCDVDIAGSRSTLADAECVAVADAALRALGFSAYTIRVNDRRILSDLARRAGASGVQQELSVLIALDKLDKVGRSGVEDELVSRGFDPTGLAPLWGILDRDGAAPATDAAVLDALEPQLSDDGRAGVAAVRALISAAVAMGVPRERLAFDPSLARGADYYTGPVFEIAGDEPGVGSLGGGGRYDGLVERLSGRDLPAVGVSLGLERLLVIMEGRGMLPEPRPAADVLVTVFDDASAAAAAAVAHAMREGGARAELFVGDGRAKAQFKYAGRRGFRWVAIVGPDEIAAGTVTLKGGPDGGTQVLPVAEAVRRVAGVDPAPGAR